MNRRQFLAAAGGTLATVGGGSAWYLGGESDSDTRGDTPTPAQTPADPPENIEAIQPLATAFYRRIQEYYPDSRVFITREGEIAMSFQTTSESSDALASEFHRIADEYVRVLENGDSYPVTTLSIVTGKVQALVPSSSLRAYVAGDINKRAFRKTIEVTDVER